MKLLAELIGFGRKQPIASPEEDPAAKLERIKAKAAAFDAQRQKQAAVADQEGGIADPRKAKALTTQPASPSVPQSPDEVIADFKSQVTRLLSSYTGKAKLEQMYIELKKQGNDPLTNAKRQIAFNALTSGGRGNFEGKKDTRKTV